MNKFLIVIPLRSTRGGISEYYNIFEKYVSKSLPYSFFERGNRNYRQKNYILYLYYLLNDYFRFIVQLFSEKCTIVINTSLLSKVSLVRDSIFLMIGKFFGNKIVVFFHGWQDEFVCKNINKFWFKLFFKADSAIVIRNHVREVLENNGFRSPVFHSSTMVDDELLHDISFEDVIENKFQKEIINLLFLARVETSKGIYEILNAYEMLKNENPNFRLTIAGDGNELKNVKNYVQKQELKNIVFTGYVNGHHKQNVFLNSDIYVFPSYTEGMPTSLLEAMAFGLPIITTKVGAITDFFEEGKHGFSVPVKEVPPIVKGIKMLMEAKRRNEISKYNFEYSKKNFLASNVTSKNESILRKISRHE